MNFKTHFPTTINSMENKYLQKTRTIWEIIRTDFRNSTDNSTDIANSIAISPGGNYIYLAGETNALDPEDPTSPQNINFAVVKYRTSDGLRVKKFGNSSPKDGKLITNFSSDSNDKAHSIAISPDGDYIFVAGETNAPGTTYHPNFTVVKYRTSDGTRDTEFGNSEPKDGKLITNFQGTSSEKAFSIVISPDGQFIYLCGESTAPDPVIGGGGYNFAVMKYKSSNGEPDETFGNSLPSFDGRLLTDIRTSTDIARSIVISGDYIYLAGKTNAPEGSGDIGSEGDNFVVVKYTSNGSIVTSFGNSTPENGKLITNFGDNNEDVAHSIAISPDGDHIYVAGQTSALDPEDTNPTQNANFAVVKYTSNGSIVTSFGNSTQTINGEILHQPNGKLIANIMAYDSVKKIAISSDNYIYVAGFTYAQDPEDTTSSQNANFAVVKYTSNGIPDDTFGNSVAEDGSPARDGKLITNIGIGSDDKASSLVISDGYIYVAGQTSALDPTADPTLPQEKNFAVVKYKSSDGSPVVLVKEKMMTTNGIIF